MCLVIAAFNIPAYYYELRRLRNTVTSFREHFLLAIIVIMKMKGVSDIKVTGRQGSEPTFHELSNIL